MARQISRRDFMQIVMIGTATTSLSACMPRGLKDLTSNQVTLAPIPQQQSNAPQPSEQALAPFASMYGSEVDGAFTLPAIPYQKIDPQFLRQIVDDPTGEQPGTIVVDTNASPVANCPIISAVLKSGFVRNVAAAALTAAVSRGV